MPISFNVSDINIDPVLTDLPCFSKGNPSEDIDSRNLASDTCYYLHSAIRFEYQSSISWQTLVFWERGNVHFRFFETQHTPGACRKQGGFSSTMLPC